MDQEHLASDTDDGVRIKWRSIATMLLIVTAASVATLVVVASIKNVDILSTVALALAVLAFAAQLILSLAQAQQSTHQQTQSERINSQTQAALADVRSTSQALLSNQTDLFNKILDAALPGATKDAIYEIASVTDSDTPRVAEFDPEELATNVERRVRDAIRELSPSLVDAASPTPKNSDSWIDKKLDRDEMQRVRTVLNALNAMLASFCNLMLPRMVRAGHDYRKFSQMVTYLHQNSNARKRYEELAMYGLIRHSESDTTHKSRIVARISLTDDGAALVRLLAGGGTAPGFFSERPDGEASSDHQVR